MEEYVRHANQNYAFYEKICQQWPDDYFDWKVTILFYVAFHYLKALAKHRKKEIGNHHFQINRNIRRGDHHPSMPLSDTACDNYMDLFHYSQASRYDSIPDMVVFKKARKEDYIFAQKCFTDFRKYIVSSGVKLEELNK